MLRPEYLIVSLNAPLLGFFICSLFKAGKVKKRKEKKKSVQMSKKTIVRIRHKHLNYLHPYSSLPLWKTLKTSLVLEAQFNVFDKLDYRLVFLIKT